MLPLLLSSLSSSSSLGSSDVHQYSGEGTDVPGTVDPYDEAVDDDDDEDVAVATRIECVPRMTIQQESRNPPPRPWHFRLLVPIMLLVSCARDSCLRERPCRVCVWGVLFMICVQVVPLSMWVLLVPPLLIWALASAKLLTKYDMGRGGVSLGRLDTDRQEHLLFSTTREICNRVMDRSRTHKHVKRTSSSTSI